MSPPEITLYGRDGCHLCDDAREVLERLRATTPFRLHLVDIESDDDLLRRYLERIPVVEVDGVVASELVLDEAAVRARLDTVGAWSR